MSASLDQIARELRLIRKALERLSPPPPPKDKPPRTFVTSRKW